MSTAEQALLPAVTSSADAANAARWHILRNVPLRLSVDIALPAMSLRSLGALEPGQVLPSAVSTDEDLTIAIGGAPVCLARFEYMDGHMSIRTTRLLGAAGGSVAPAAVAAPPASAPAGAAA